ncbi:hyalin-like [Amphiura filiformis]|uniref:hyalin-like n=1 Tax=Amphiura filiformis TaxID=82378 RepID=UPI003B21D4A8
MVDNEDPLFSNTPSDITVDTESGLSTAVVTWTEPTVTDNSGDYTVTSNYNSGYRFPLGTTRVRYYAWDASGNNVTSEFNVTIEDNEDPLFSNTPNDITVDTESGLSSAVVTWTEPTVTDNSGDYTVTSNYNSGYRFPLGTTTVKYYAWDASGNNVTFEFNVTVEDNEDTMFSNTPGDITVDTESGLSTAVVTWTEPTVMDNSGDYTVTSTYNSGYRFPLGTTTVRYYAWDASGNNVTYAFNVTVEDNEDPLFSNIPSDITVDTESGLSTAVVTWTEPTVTDNSGDYTVTSNYNSGYRFPLGTTRVRYYAWDASGNNVTFEFNVTIEDNEDPLFSNTPSDITVDTESGLSTAVVTWTEPTVTDNSGDYTVTSNYNSGYRFPLGTTTVKYYAWDASGNNVTFEFNVTVEGEF